MSPKGYLYKEIADALGMGVETVRRHLSNNGVRNTRQRIEFIGGQFELCSRPGEGLTLTQSQIVVPSSNPTNVGYSLIPATGNNYRDQMTWIRYGDGII